MIPPSPHPYPRRQQNSRARGQNKLMKSCFRSFSTFFIILWSRSLHIHTRPHTPFQISWCLDGCHAFNKTYINSRASLLEPGSVSKTCSPVVVQLFHAHLCREPEAIACTYLSARTNGTDLAKLETAMKGSSEYAKGACKH